MKYFCCDQLRRDQVEGSALNGIDYLEVLDKDAPLFSAFDFLALASLITKLTAPAPSDHISPFLWANFSPQTQQVLTNPGSTTQQQVAVLVPELNKVLQNGVSIYSASRFSGVSLSPRTVELLGQNPQGTELTRLNRLLLEDAYPSEIAKSPDRQCILLVHFINDLAGPALTAGNVLIAGGVRIRNIAVVGVAPQVHGIAKVLAVQVNEPGDFSTYTLSLVQDSNHPTPPTGYDPVLSSVDFSFKVECPSDFDCKPIRVCPKEPAPEPEIDYLSRDYTSFRRLLLDRMTLLMPQWQERHPADLGVALVELLAFVGDYLSYQQDAIATEAYLGTAHRRISVRRHARLVDYLMHDGCNARAWVQIQVSADTTVPLPKGTRLLTRVAGQPVVLPNDPALIAQADAVFETMYDVPNLFSLHNEMYFYTWANKRCCLPKGATRATLGDHFPNLKAGDVLIFEEVLGPLTGQPEDADPSRRHAVRLTHVVSTDASNNSLTDPLQAQPQRITEIEWANDDALPFPLCISAKTDKQHGEQYYDNVSVARGNIVLADHGLTTQEAPVPDTVPQSSIFRPPLPAVDRCAAVDPVPVPPRYRPRLAKSPLTVAASYEEPLLFGLAFTPQQETDLDQRILPSDVTAHFVALGISFVSPSSIQGSTPDWSISDGERAYRIRKEPGPVQLMLNVYELAGPAHSLTQQMPSQALPKVILTSQLKGDSAEWHPVRDLFNSASDATEFVAETEADGSAWLRFGDDTLGHRPEPDTTFIASYRTGNGVAGNIGAEALAHVVGNFTGITTVTVRNPLPGQGGLEPESIEDVRQYAPAAFRIQERAVTEDDYAEVTGRDPRVQRAKATFRWTGSWHTAFLTVDRVGGLEVDAQFKNDIRSEVERYRMAGYDLEVDGPTFVPLDVAMHVCVQPDHFRSHVKEALLELFSNQVLPDGRQGLFYPDNFTFGQTVYLSKLYAAAQAVPGVSSVQITKFQRRSSAFDPQPLADGEIQLGRLEIAQLDNDPNFPERGVFTLTLGGGK